MFPINNKPEPNSLWTELHPRVKMRWEWNESGDDRVSRMWYLMKKLSDCKKVVYSKWYQSRATFFSRDLFTAMVCIARKEIHPRVRLSRPAREILDTLESDSPLSTKQLKRLTELQGKENESTYQRAMKELFNNFLVIAFGEVDDGAFPSLAVGATKHIYEDLWFAANELPPKVAWEIINKYLPEENLFRKQFEKIRRNGVQVESVET